MVGKKNIAIFASAIKTIGIFRGALVQLVRMPACHAGGHEFESRTHRLTLIYHEYLHQSGALVQLVRMPACHAGGHEFESRTHRKEPLRRS